MCVNGGGGLHVYLLLITIVGDACKVDPDGGTRAVSSAVTHAQRFDDTADTKKWLTSKDSPRMLGSKARRYSDPNRNDVSELGASSVKCPPMMATDTIQMEERLPTERLGTMGPSPSSPRKIFKIQTNGREDCNLRAATLLRRVGSRNLDAD